MLLQPQDNGGQASLPHGTGELTLGRTAEREGKKHHKAWLNTGLPWLSAKFDHQILVELFRESYI